MTTQSDELVTPNKPKRNGKTDEIVLEWLKQRGNYERFLMASGVAKRKGRTSESKHDVAASVCTLLENAGIQGCNPHAVTAKLNVWIRQYKRALAMEASGASRNQVKRAFCYYYDLVEHLEDESCFGEQSQGVHSIRPSKPPNSNYRQRRWQLPIATLHAPHYQMMNQLLQRQQQMLAQQTRRDHLQELELQAALIERMTEAGFTKDEIGEHFRKLQGNYRRCGIEPNTSRLHL